MNHKKLIFFIAAISFSVVIGCISCDLQQGKRETIGGVIASTLYFEARQDYAIPIVGFIIVASKRHIQSIDEFTSEEQADFIQFLSAIRKIMREKLNIVMNG